MNKNKDIEIIVCGMLPGSDFAPLKAIIPHPKADLLLKIVDGLIVWIADAVASELEGADDSISARLEQAIVRPGMDAVANFEELIVRYALFPQLANAVSANLPWALKAIACYHQAWGDRLPPVLESVPGYQILGPSVGAGTGIWDDHKPEDFGISKGDRHPELPYAEIDGNTTYDLVECLRNCLKN